MNNAFARRLDNALRDGLSQEDYDKAQELFANHADMALLVERIALGTRLDKDGLNYYHDDDSLMELAARIPNSGCVYTSKRLKSIAVKAASLHAQIKELRK